MKLRTVLAAASLLSTAACATVMNGSEQGIAVNSTPAGANISVDGQPMGVTPAVLRLARSKEHILQLDLPGYLPYQMKLSRRTSGWVWGNIAFGGVIGVVVDASTGAMYRLTPEAVDAGMETRVAVIDGQPTIEVAIVMSPDASWEKIGQLSRD
jgi:hypothetical protein